MILKYQVKDLWGFIDNLRQVAHKDLDIDELVKKYDDEKEKEDQENGYQDPAVYLEGKRLPENIVKSNKAFSMAASNTLDEGFKSHSENLLDEERLEYPATVILLYLEGCKEYDAVQIVTNQKAYLLNDKGQTIERLN